MGTERVRIGLLFSTTGPYATIGQAMYNGARLAVEEVSADPTFPFHLETVDVDAGGSNERYAAAAERMLTTDGLVHVVGCYTSSSRKEVLPFFEKHDGLLWYPSHYEGFESSEHVIYTGAAPNQHIVPLAQYMLRSHGRRAFCIGSNYIWAWENNKIMREAVLAAGGAVLAERYFPVGETDFDGVIDQILAMRPSFVFNTLIGLSAYEFFRAFRRAAGSARHRPGHECPDRELQPLRARARRDRQRGLRRACEFERLLREHRHGAATAHSCRPIGGASRRRPDVGRCRVLLSCGASPGARHPRGAQQRDAGDPRRLSRASASTRHRARCASTAAIGTAS